MKRKMIELLIITLLTNLMYSQTKIDNGLKYYFNKLIPEYYKGQESFYEKESTVLLQRYGFHMQGDGFSTLEMTNAISFDFYMLEDHKKQDIQVIKISETIKNHSFYEYWMLLISCRGVPCNYGLFYVTKADSIMNSREIIKKTDYYQEFVILDNNQKLDSSDIDLRILYQIKPWIELDSFKGSKYEGVLVKWHGDYPYIRKQNPFERLYYKSLKKTNIIIQ